MHPQKCDATMAQLVEQRIRNAWVPGSSPGSGSETKTSSIGCGFCFVHINIALRKKCRQKDYKLTSKL